MIGDEAARPHQQRAAKPGVAGDASREHAGGPMTGEAGLGGAIPVSLPVRLTGEAVSILAMALATLAIGMALNLHGGFAIWTAVACAVACYAVMLVGHALMPRHYAVDKVPASGSIARAPGLPVEGNGAATERATRAGFNSGPPQRARAPSRTASEEPTTAPDKKPAGHPQAGGRAPGKHSAVVSAPAGAGYWGGVSATYSEELADPFAPPTEPRDQAKRTHVVAAPPMPVAAQQATPPPLSSAPLTAGISPRESDVEMIQGLIRKLADEVNAASVSPPKGAAAAAAVSERAIAASVDALKATAGSMRSRDDAAQRRLAATAECQPDELRSETGRPPEVNARLSVLAEALALGRVEVLLDPIVDFNAGAPRHFELYLRLRDERGRVIDTDQAREEFAGTGMLARIDGARMAHASQVAVRFTGRGRDNALFSTVSGEALSAHKFLQGVADAYRERRSVAGALIMTFSQADVRGFGAREWNALSEFAGIGFRYCISDVMDLDMDFEHLKSRGFNFAKLDAAVFLEGLPAGNEIFIPAQDICKHLAGIGLSVIVGGMKNENTAAKVFGFGVLYGQGALFGGAKAVKRELIAGGGHEAA